MVTENMNSMCTGCGICAAVCPQKCLDIRLDAEGFYKAVCEERSCVQCGLCDRVCPKYIDCAEKKPVYVASAIAMNGETLRTTSSGGLCYELAKQALAEGKKVCGCIYNYERHRAEHAVITEVADLESTKGSKYFQSYTSDAFAQLMDGGQWVVFGSPCQIAAVDAMARQKNKRENFLLVDFFCHGVPSMHLWKKYIAEKGGDKIKKIDFRSKEFGWHAFSLRFTYQNGEVHSDCDNNMFYRFFLGNYCLGEACYTCKFKALKSAADIRVGDYWGDKYKQNREGVSCCVAFTQRGADAIGAVSAVATIQNEDLEQVLEEQMSESPKRLRLRKRVMKQLQGKKSLKRINDTTLFCYRAKWKMISVIRSLK